MKSMFNSNGTQSQSKCKTNRIQNNLDQINQSDVNQKQWQRMKYMERNN